MSVPKAMQGIYGQIEPLITDFCQKYLDADYQTLCLRLLEKLCRKRPSPLLSGKANTWAAGIVYAICSNNFIFDKSQPIHHTADELCAPFGLAKSTVANKAGEISRMFKITRNDHQWLLPHLIEKNPFIWMMYVDGFLTDIREAPLAVQLQAYKQGLIPYVPALQAAQEKLAAQQLEEPGEPPDEQGTEDASKM